jgi:hypothetical protein
METAIAALSPVQASPYLESAGCPLQKKTRKKTPDSQIAGFQRHSALSSMTDYRKSTASTAPWLAKTGLF